MRRFKLAWLLVLLLLGCNSEPSGDEARRQLGTMGIKYNESSFVDAAETRDILAVKLFMIAGMKVDVRDSPNRLAFMLVRDYAEPSIIGAENVMKAVGKAESDPTTALMAASVAGRADVVKLLIAKGADVNLKDRVGMTALDYAMKQGHSEVQELLVDSGAERGVSLRRE